MLAIEPSYPNSEPEDEHSMVAPAPVDAVGPRLEEPVVAAPSAVVCHCIFIKVFLFTLEINKEENQQILGLNRYLNSIYVSSFFYTNFASNST